MSRTASADADAIVESLMTMPRILDGRRASRDSPRGMLADTCCAKSAEAQAAKLRLWNRAALKAVTNQPAFAAPQLSLRGNDQAG